MENNTTKVSHQQLAAKKYIEENEIEKIISEMLNTLVHEKSKQPIVYMIKYLAGLLSEDEIKQNGLVIPEPYPKGKPIVKFPNLEKTHPNCILKKHLNKNIWDSLKHTKTKYGGNIMNICKLSENNSEDKIGFILTDGNCINSFVSLLAPLLSDLHKLKNPINLNEFYKENINLNFDNFPNYEIVKENIVNFRISYSRNIQDFPFSPIMTCDKRQQIENILLKGITSMVNDKVLNDGRFLTFKENETEINQILKDIQFDQQFLKSAELNLSWPENRQLFITNDMSVIILINFIDHLQLIVKKVENIISNNSNQFFNFLTFSYNLIKSFENYFTFEFDKNYGFINTYPLLLGAGLQITSELKLENDFMKILENLNFDYFKSENKNLILKSYYRLCYSSEIEFIEDYYRKICGLINLDKDKNKLEYFLNNKLELDDKNDVALFKAYNTVYDEYKYTLDNYGNNLNYLVRNYKENPLTKFGIIFNEDEEYKTFQRLVREYTLLNQNFDINQNDNIIQNEIKEKDFINFKSSQSGKHLMTNLILIRNISGYPFVISKNNKNSDVERVILKALEEMKMKNFNSRYFKLESEEAKSLIEENNILLFNNEELILKSLQFDFPTNRGIIIFENEETKIFAVINDIDHIKLQIKITDDNIHNHLINLLKLTNELCKHLKFAYDKQIGFLTTSPRYAGTGLIIKTQLQLKNLIEENLMSNSDFNNRIISKEDGIIEISNKLTIGKTETDLFSNLVNFSNEIISKNEEIKAD